MRTINLFLTAIIIIFGCNRDSASNTIQTVKLGNLEIMTTDLGKMTNSKGKAACLNQGSGWRLPTRDEMILIAQNRDKVPGIVTGGEYWTSTEFNPGFNDYIYIGITANSYFGNSSTDPTYKCFIRAVKFF